MEGSMIKNKKQTVLLINKDESMELYINKGDNPLIVKENKNNRKKNYNYYNYIAQISVYKEVV
jgi:hypothetical protein